MTLFRLTFRSCKSDIPRKTLRTSLPGKTGLGQNTPSACAESCSCYDYHHHIMLTCLGKGRVSVRPLWLMVMKPSSMSMLGVPYSPMVPSFTRWHSGASSCSIGRFDCIVTQSCIDAQRTYCLWRAHDAVLNTVNQVPLQIGFIEARTASMHCCETCRK